MKNILLIIIFLFISSCNGIEFVYKEKTHVINPLYEKTKVSTSGVDINFINSYLPMLFGQNSEDLFNLSIKIDEKKTKISVEKNQATSNLRYELRFKYTLISKENNCITYEKELLSYFSIIPKSSGYNYGSDTSLEKKYELAVTENLNQFISKLSDVDIYNC
ncbi:hypothetical protein OA855_03215 [Pelagibacteraceae bacterium]|nr:hypothetical protein [Pelagibacteraceae bacterium]MDC3156789.1 hypothetical protein [Pelagibacteraceae bacterium]